MSLRQADSLPPTQAPTRFSILPTGRGPNVGKRVPENASEIGPAYRTETISPSLAHAGMPASTTTRGKSAIRRLATQAAMTTLARGTLHRLKGGGSARIGQR